MNVAIHRYFWERSPVWQKIYAEEQEVQAAVDVPPSSDVLQDDDVSDTPDDPDVERKQLHFDPIDARFLSSLALVRARIIKLLKNSTNHIHVYANILLAIVRSIYFNLVSYSERLTDS